MSQKQREYTDQIQKERKIEKQMNYKNNSKQLNLNPMNNQIKNLNKLSFWKEKYLD